MENNSRQRPQRPATSSRTPKSSHNELSTRNTGTSISESRPRRPLTKQQRLERHKKRRRRVYMYRAAFAAIILLVLLLLGISISSLVKHINKDKADETTSPAIEVETEELPIVEEENNTVSFLAVGDNMGHERVYTYADENSGEAGDGEYDFLPSYEYMVEYIEEADLAFINQESIIGGDELGISGYPAFNSPEQWAYDLVTLGFDVVNSATNHSLDMGYTAIENSIETFSQFDDIVYTGVYNSEEDASTVKTIERNGITFAFLSYTYGTNGYELPNSYCVKLLDEDTIREDVAAAKEVSDVVIVSAHWGTESSYELNSTQLEYAQLFADLEVDLVVGHHPHVIQSLEWITGENGNETLVAYSLGNFLSTMETVDTQLEGMLTLDFIKGDDGEVTIENVEWTALINHFGDGTFNVRPLSEYTDELNAVHYVLADQCPNAIETFQEITLDTIGDEFTINY